MADNRRPYRSVLSTAQHKIAAAIRQIRGAIPHTGEVGALVEEQFRSQLTDVLPEKVGVSHGFVVDADGQVSRQLDIILYDKMNCPRIFSSSGAQMFPVEMTYACGEIKTMLDRSKFKDSFDKCLSYKRLHRKAYVRTSSPIVTTHTLFGRKWEHWQSIFFIVGVESSELTSLQTAYREIVIHGKLGIHERIDTIVTLNDDKRNVLLNVSGRLIEGVPSRGSIDLLPSPGSNLCSYRAKEPWSLFIILLLRYMTQVPAEPVNMVPYGAEEPF